MNVKAIVTQTQFNNAPQVKVGFYDLDLSFGFETYNVDLDVSVDIIAGYTGRNLYEIIRDRVIAHAAAESITLVESDIYWVGMTPMIPSEAFSLVAARQDVWLNSVLKPNVSEYTGHASVSSGTVVFNLTTDGTSAGTAIFSDVFPESIACSVETNSGDYQFGSFTVSGNKKTLTVTVTTLTATGLTLLGTTVLGSITRPSAANGTVIKLRVLGTKS